MCVVEALEWVGVGGVVGGGDVTVRSAQGSSERSQLQTKREQEALGGCAPGGGLFKRARCCSAPYATGMLASRGFSPGGEGGDLLAGGGGEHGRPVPGWECRERTGLETGASLFCSRVKQFDPFDV